MHVKLIRYDLVALALIVIATWTVSALVGLQTNAREKMEDDPTRRFIRSLDISRYEHMGSDFTNPRYSPLRLGKSLVAIDRKRDYDFAQLANIQKRLQYVDRRTALQAIFSQVTKGVTSPKEKHLRVLGFLHKASNHNPHLTATYPDGQTVYDPLVLLELGEMLCGQVARVAIDLFAAAGYPGRMVQLGGHQVAEIYYEGNWHLLDADVFGNGESVFLDDGTIPSVTQLSREPFQIDALAAYWEPNWRNSAPGARPYPSWNYFAKDAYPACEYEIGPCYYYKVANREQERNSRLYGWEHIRKVADRDRVLHDIPRQATPAAPVFTGIRLMDASPDMRIVRIAWKQAHDSDGDLHGYRIFVSQMSRGWNYDGESLPAQLISYKSRSENWNPSKYESRFHLPAYAEMIQTSQTHLELQLRAGTDHFITVMPFDAHGELVRKKIYPMSEEIRIPGR